MEKEWCGNSERDGDITRRGESKVRKAKVDTVPYSRGGMSDLNEQQDT